MILALNKPMWANSNNIGVELTESDIFDLGADIEGFLASKGIVCGAVQVQE